MRALVCVLTVLTVIVSQGSVHARDVREYIDEARKLSEAGDLKGALALLAQAAQEHPSNSDVHAYLGLYTGMSAGSASDYLEAGQLSFQSFELLDKAVALDSSNHRAYLYRGIMGVKVPTFLGRLEGAISDLKHVIELHEASPDQVTDDDLVTAYVMLAEGYQKNGDVYNERVTLEKVVEVAPGSKAAESAKDQLGKLPAGAETRDPFSVRPQDSKEIAAMKAQLQGEPGDTGLIMRIGQAYFQEQQYEAACEVLKEYIARDQSNAEAYRLLGISVAQVAGHGYDDRIAEDTNYRAGLTFESINYIDKAVELSPNDASLRLLRGMFGVMFPFFIGRHEQGVKDLEYVVESDAPEDEKAQAMYYLGVAHQRRAMRYWIEVATKHPASEAARMVLDEMRPELVMLDPAKHEKPFVAIDFVLGFRDELAPQTAVWIEDSQGGYVKTIYVSGFSGHAKGKQVNLPIWADKSRFEGIDAVTSASIDLGHHIYTWDTTDGKGKRVAAGKYTVKVEVSYWPSMKYQLAEAIIEIGKQKNGTLVEEGDCIPRLELTYYRD